MIGLLVCIALRGDVVCLPGLQKWHQGILVYIGKVRCALE